VITEDQITDEEANKESIRVIREYREAKRHANSRMEEELRAKLERIANAVGAPQQPASEPTDEECCWMAGKTVLEYQQAKLLLQNLEGELWRHRMSMSHVVFMLTNLATDNLDCADQLVNKLPSSTSLLALINQFIGARKRHGACLDKLREIGLNAEELNPEASK
jgi:hypothetical protein